MPLAQRAISPMAPLASNWLAQIELVFDIG